MSNKKKVNKDYNEENVIHEELENLQNQLANKFKEIARSGNVVDFASEPYEKQAELDYDFYIYYKLGEYMNWKAKDFYANVFLVDYKKVINVCKQIKNSKSKETFLEFLKNNNDYIWVEDIFCLNTFYNFLYDKELFTFKTLLKQGLSEILKDAKGVFYNCRYLNNSAFNDTTHIFVSFVDIKSKKQDNFEPYELLSLNNKVIANELCKILTKKLNSKKFNDLFNKSKNIDDYKWLIDDVYKKLKLWINENKLFKYGY